MSNATIANETKRTYATSAQTLGFSLPKGARVKLNSEDGQYYFVIRSGGHNVRIAFRKGETNKENTRLVEITEITPAPYADGKLIRSRR